MTVIPESLEIKSTATKLSQKCHFFYKQFALKRKYTISKTSLLTLTNQ